jgi:hypothetical protein
VARGEFGLASGTAVEFAAFCEEAGAGGAVDGAIDSPAAEEGLVGAVDDGVDVELGDVGLEDVDSGQDVRGHEGILIGVGGKNATLNTQHSTLKFE